MKVMNLTDSEIIAIYYIDSYNDILDSKAEAELLGLKAVIIVDGLYVGTQAQMKQSALEKYLIAIDK